jgi:hypothetical protein
MIVVMRWLRVSMLLLCCAAAQAQGPKLPDPAASQPALSPPVAQQRPYLVKSPHGDRSDVYHWLRDDDPKAKRPEVLQYLEAENRYTEAVLAPLKGLRDRLYAEMAARVKGDESTLPVYDHGWWVWRQYEPSIEHPKLMRRRGGPEGPDPAARAEVLLDLPQHAIAQRFYGLGMAQVSPDGHWLAWTEDVLGRGSHDLYIQDLRSRRLAPERIRGVLEGVAWGGDSRTLFYVRHDTVTLHSGTVMRHRLGADPGGRRRGARRGRQDAVRQRAQQRVAAACADRHPGHRRGRTARGAGGRAGAAGRGGVPAPRRRAAAGRPCRRPLAAAHQRRRAQLQAAGDSRPRGGRRPRPPRRLAHPGARARRRHAGGLRGLRRQRCHRGTCAGAPPRACAGRRRPRAARGGRRRRRHRVAGREPRPGGHQRAGGGAVHDPPAGPRRRAPGQRPRDPAPPGPGARARPRRLPHADAACTRARRRAGARHAGLARRPGAPRRQRAAADRGLRCLW